MNVGTLTGASFGSLVVIGDASAQGGHARILCRCACGTEKPIRRSHLLSGASKSCGCGRVKHGLLRRGAKKPDGEACWRSMRQRCENPNAIGYDQYGGRGITVCGRWKSLPNFLADMGPRPSAGHSIDRIDNDGNYEPGNCRWATAEEQNRNTRANVLDERGAERIREMRGQGMSYGQIAKETGLSVQTIADVSQGKTWRRLPAGMRAALEAIHGPHAPLTAAELREFEASRAAEMKRAEARRVNEVQGDLWSTT